MEAARKLLAPLVREALAGDIEASATLQDVCVDFATARQAAALLVLARNPSNDALVTDWLRAIGELHRGHDLTAL